MRDILIACSTPAEAERGLRLAGDLSVACGASVSLVASSLPPMTTTPAAALDAAGYLSTVLFARDPHGQAPSFAAARPVWLAEIRDRVHECWDTDTLSADVRARRPELVIACNADLARDLVSRTSVPVWHLKSRERSWFSARTIRCAIRGTRATEWARAFASSLNVELQATPATTFSPTADLMVIDREHRTAWPSLRPLVVV
jgi:hypothetical protein